MESELDPDLIPLSALQHAVYCLRQAALIHLERIWEENRFTAEGQIVHAKVHEVGARRARGVRRVNGLSIACRRLGVAGVADLVEYRRQGDRETAFPVEYKRGKPKLHRADEVQLCAQALCLEEMHGAPVTEGALYYAETKRRTIVPFDVELRALTEATIERLRAVFESRTTPPAEYQQRKCTACSLLVQCRPKAASRSARAWRDRAVIAILAEGAEP